MRRGGRARDAQGYDRSNVMPRSWASEVLARLTSGATVLDVDCG